MAVDPRLITRSDGACLEVSLPDNCLFFNQNPRISRHCRAVSPVTTPKASFAKSHLDHLPNRKRSMRCSAGRTKKPPLVVNSNGFPLRESSLFC